MPAPSRLVRLTGMSIQIGYLDDNGHPRITIRVSGTHPTASAVVEAMIDTGFTGFLMLPIAQALPLGLALYGTGNYTLADGSSVTNFLAQPDRRARHRGIHHSSDAGSARGGATAGNCKRNCSPGRRRRSFGNGVYPKS